MPSDPLEHFRRLVAQQPLPLLAVAAEVPRYADPGCQPAAVLERVQAWGRQLAERLAPDAAAPMRWRQLNHFFFDELGFRGNVDAYDEPENSWLDRVIERRTGIPITLSLLYLELGRAAGLKLRGVGFPGHFLVRLPLADGSMMIDVFGGGVPLSSAMLQARLAAVTRGAVEAPLDVYLRPAADRDILARLLRNLQRLHLRSGEAALALEVQHRLLALLPDDAHEHRTRAGIYEVLECPRAAAQDLERYLSLADEVPDMADTRDRLDRLQREAARLN